MQLLEGNISHLKHQLIKLFGGVLELPDMQSKALDLWNSYIGYATIFDQRNNINAIVHGLCGRLDVSSVTTRKEVASTLHYLLDHNPILTEEDYANLPVLPPFEELAAVQRRINERRDVKNVEKKVFVISIFPRSHST
ncbi:hypothetical protein MBANPS3_012506 [Mucor bainieri]